jgi:hypothetical protein
MVNVLRTWVCVIDYARIKVWIYGLTVPVQAVCYRVGIIGKWIFFYMKPFMRYGKKKSILRYYKRKFLDSPENF